MKNERAFTLIELIATILIICLISLIAVTSINKVIRDSNSKGHKINIDGILSSAQAYTADNSNILVDVDTNGSYTIQLSTLVSKGYIDSKIVDTINNKEIDMSSSYITITIETDTSSVDNTDLDYKFDGQYLYVLTIVYK